MPSPASRFLPLFLGSSLGLSIILLAGGLGPSRIAPAPSTIAMVDVVGVLQGLTEFADRNAEFTARGEAYKKDLTALADKIKQGETDLNDTIPPNDLRRRADKLREMYENQALLQARNEGYKRLIEIEQGDVIHVLYGKQLAAVAALAKKEGFDLILSDDRAGNTLPNAPFTDNRRRMEARSIVFANDALSITDRVITIMNNDYASGGGKSAPSPSNPPMSSSPAPR